MKALTCLVPEAGSYATGGLGGVLAGSVFDHTASQGALAYDQPIGSVTVPGGAGGEGIAAA